MGPSIPMNDIQNLPQLLIQCIRGGTWQSPNKSQIRVLARTLFRAQALDIDIADPLVRLAAVARADLPVPNADWTPEMRVIADLIWPFLASPFALRCEFDNACALMPLDVLRTHFADWLSAEITKITTTPALGHQIIAAEVERLAQAYPQIGLSFGYLGNVWTNPRRDDRSFTVFTKLNGRMGSPVRFGGHGYAQLGLLAHLVTSKLETWVRDLVMQLQSNSVVLRAA